MIEPNANEQSCLVGDGLNLAEARRGHRSWFFYQYMFAGFQRSQRQVSQQRMGCADDHGVNVGVLENVFAAHGCPAAVMLLRNFCRLS